MERVHGAQSNGWAKVKNNDLAAKTSVTASDMTGGRDTAAKLTDLQARIDAYAASITKPRDAVASGSTATKQLSDEFDAADAALNDQMDALVPQFAAANAKFVEDYHNARIIVDSGGGKAKVNTPTPKPPTP